MLTPDQIDNIRPKLISIQIISAVLIVGALVFTAMICAIVDWDNLNERLKMLSMIGAVSGILMLGMSFVVPKVFSSGEGGLRSDNSDQSEVVKTTLHSLMVENLIRYALIEAALFLNLMVFLIEPHRAALLIVGIGVLTMLICFPRQSKMIAEIENRLA